jgi:hypothetical protein
MISDLSEQLADHRLVGETRRSHSVSHALDQFPPFVVGPATVVGVSKDRGGFAEWLSHDENSDEVVVYFFSITGMSVCRITSLATEPSSA